MQFVHQALTWGFLLALVPLLIHLINLVRRRRVQWAAMDFLLQSYKRHRTWIWLKQLLLLLSRMAAVAIIVAMLAQWITQREWFSLFGGTATHHYVILDDSFSMTDRVGGTTAFDRASRALQNIGTQAMLRETPQKLTVLRFSRTAGVDPSSANAESAAD
ncbi:MAG: BatA domain-containing protein, partial [Pirellulaceae bacterium]|nr:BatA domain-containing protein [Pirellulaceae bacterium]